MEEHYVYDKDDLSFKKVVVPKIKRKVFGDVTYLNLIVYTTCLALGTILGVVITSKTIIINEFDSDIVSKHDLIIGSNKWKDSVFSEYKEKADLYLSREEFEGTPIKGEMLALAAENAYDSTGILLPVELCLAQCQWESGMGLKGKSPKNNPFNIGEYDSGTVIWFDNTFEGVQAYYYLMTTKYLSCSSIHELFNNFVNCSGHRYASGSYEEHVPKQYYFIVKWLEDAY